MDRVSDEMITAWLDGEVTPQQRSEIESAIAAHGWRVPTGCWRRRMRKR